MSFLEPILAKLRERPEHVFLQEALDGRMESATGAELVSKIDHVRGFARRHNLEKGERCALLGGNSIAWAAADLGLMAEGVIVVPLYGRQKASELVGILRDCTPRFLLCATAAERDAILGESENAPETFLLSEVLAAEPAAGFPDRVGADDLITIIYTSGTSGEPKGVGLRNANLEFMLRRTHERMSVLMQDHHGPERVFHYLPFCFAGSWIMLLLSLQRGSTLTLNTDLTRIVDDVALARPHYFQNVPVLLERMRGGIRNAIAKRGRLWGGIFEGAYRAWIERASGHAVGAGDRMRLAVARKALFPSIRKKIGEDLRALICGSAPLPRETQLFFEMLGIPVLQVYGLTETTAICTMDSPGRTEAGRVGGAIDGVEMRLGTNDEILVRGPNVFRGYWNREAATEAAFEGEWFRTGDQGEVDEAGNWRIVGRLKNLLVPASGHNVAPEPIEEKLATLLPKAEQIVLVGNGRAHLAVIVAGAVSEEEVDAALEELNEGLPHYRKVRGSLVVPDAFTVESGLLTANGKLRRDAVAERLADEIDRLFAAEEVPA
jgi:long-chain acyl-CoA synthetase